MRLLKMRAINKTLSIVCSFFFLTAVQTTVANAKSISGYVDNDTNVSGYSNDSKTYTHYDGTWGTYLHSGNNGDARLRQSTTKACYEWVWYGDISTTSSVSWTAKVYLSNSSFTDTKAHYEIMCDSNEYIPFCSFEINQNIAPSGYTAVTGTERPSVSNGRLHPWYAFVQNSGQSGVGTGADTFYFSFTYF